MLFNETQSESEYDENAGEGVAQSIEELEKELEGVENFENTLDSEKTDFSKLEPHLAALKKVLKEIGIENIDDRLENTGTQFELHTDEEHEHHNDLAILQDIEKANPLLELGFIPLNGESCMGDSGLMKYHIVIIK